MLVARRFLTLVAFAFWLGGFAFYTGVVVPVGTEVLGSPVAQGFVTRRVAFWMNVAGVASIPMLLWDAAATCSWRRSRVALTILVAIALVALWQMHPRLDAMLDPVAERVVDRPRFRPLHRQYLWVSSALFAFGVAYLMLTICAWRRMDRADATS